MAETPEGRAVDYAGTKEPEQMDGSFLVDINPDVDVLSFESFFVSLHCWNGFGGSYYFFQNYQKFRSNIFLL